jgi:hypothetical protein
MRLGSSHKRLGGRGHVCRSRPPVIDAVGYPRPACLAPEPTELMPGSPSFPVGRHLGYNARSSCIVEGR